VEPAKTKLDTLRVNSGLKEFCDVIIKNSWIEQPELALGGALSMFATLASRKFTYQGLAPNVYIANISESGTGKSFPQEEVKKLLANIRAENLIGSGDYVSYASIMDTLSLKPVRLDIWDELGGILKTINKGNGEYTAKMDDILAELYTSSNSYYMGRATAEGIKGDCYRPNVNILGSTTPTGFEEGVTKKAIDKGLLGRFLIFRGNPEQPAKRVKKLATVSNTLKNHLKWLVQYKPAESDLEIKGITQSVTELKADAEADAMLDEIFQDMDKRRRENQNSAISPIVARLYQQMIKLVIIHAVSRTFREVPIINKHDVLFAYEMINFYAEEIESIVGSLIFNSKEEKNRYIVKSVLESLNGMATKSMLINNLPSMPRRAREDAIKDLKESQLIAEDTVREDDGTISLVYKLRRQL